MVSDTEKNWPYPYWIAHRGAGRLAPENTLAAFRLGAQHGYRMFECDVKLSADGVPFLMHNASLSRTTNAADGAQTALDVTWAELSRLDAGSWHSLAYAGEPLPTLDAIARFCIVQHRHLNIEIKPVPGDEVRTGRVIAENVLRLWGGVAADYAPLLTSFSTASLQSALEVHPFRTGLLLEQWDEAGLAWAVEHGCCALVCHYSGWNAQTVGQVHQAGLKALAYTVNDDAVAAGLMAWQIDGIITDRVDHFAPDRIAGKA